MHDNNRNTGHRGTGRHTKRGGFKMTQQDRTAFAGGQLKSRGAGQPPRRYKWHEWVRGYIAWIALFPLYLFLWGFATVCPRLPQWVVWKLLRWHERTTASRPQDVRIPSNPSVGVYMRRWWKIKRNAYFNVYFHQVFRSDDDTALHDHPWWSFSIILKSGYYEHRILDGGVHQKIWYEAGSVLFRRAGKQAHRLELGRLNWQSVVDPYLQDWKIGELDDLHLDHETGTFELPAKTIFITGPVLRRWGFHHPSQWVDAYDWDDFQASKGINSMKMAGYAEQLKKGQ